MEPALQTAESAEIQKSLTLYVTETEPSPVEKRSFWKWVLVAVLALLLHVVGFYFSPHWFRPIPPPPVEVERIDPAKLAKLKNQWKQRSLLIDKTPGAPKQTEAEKKANAPTDANYESDRVRKVEHETRARVQDMNPGKSGNAKDRESAKKRPANPAKQTKIPLANLSNFKGLPVPGPRPEERTAEEETRGRPGETSDQFLGDRTVPEGAENMLNTAESVFYSFYSRMYEQIGPLWQSTVSERVYRKRPPPGEYVTFADVIFDADGNFEEARIERSSGIEEFDTAIPAAWRRIPRFPNPPRGLLQADGKIHMGWSFTVRIVEGAPFQYLPPERSY
ncbi:MAG: TonB family protein [Bdellovibrionales bacterium]|nr:TonB family protein [Bdellovibrionales bacterium]